MTKRHERLVGGVALTDEDLIPVADVEDAAEEVAAGTALRCAIEQGHVHGHRTHHRQDGRQQPAESTQPELCEIDPTGTFVFTDQQQRDQVAADDEEDLDAEEPSAQPGVIGVVEHHGNDGESAHAIQPWQVRHSIELAPGRAE